LPSGRKLRPSIAGVERPPLPLVTNGPRKRPCGAAVPQDLVGIEATDVEVSVRAERHSCRASRPPVAARSNVTRLFPDNTVSGCSGPERGVGSRSVCSWSDRASSSLPCSPRRSARCLHDMKRIGMLGAQDASPEFQSSLNQRTGASSSLPSSRSTEARLCIEVRVSGCCGPISRRRRS